MFIFLYTVFRNSSISDEHVFCVALHFTTGHFSYLTMRIIFFDNPEYYEPIKEELLGKLKKSLF